VTVRFWAGSKDLLPRPQTCMALKTFFWTP
jgi:hypothetical protein